jgi:ABC-2 type transport system ATP-binding protein
MISCQHVTKRFGQFTAVDDVSFSVSGGICALLGPNGAGKSTLIKLLTGLLAPDQGEIRVAGFDLLKQPITGRHAVGVVPEDLGLFDSLTIQEHLELCIPVYRLEKKQARERIDFLLRVLGLIEGKNTFLDRCSHGMRKKTSLAMALLHNPHVLFLDEPFEGIDPVSSKAMRDLLVAQSRQAVTIFFVSHILPMVKELATDIMMIRRGKIVFHSPSREVPKPLDDLYFDLVERPAAEDFTWLRSSPF